MKEGNVRKCKRKKGKNKQISNKGILGRMTWIEKKKE